MIDFFWLIFVFGWVSERPFEKCALLMLLFSGQVLFLPGHPYF